MEENFFDRFFCDPRVIIELRVMERNIINVFIIETSFYRMIILSMRCIKRLNIESILYTSSVPKKSSIGLKLIYNEI
jgi:hypothetical protein